MACGYELAGLPAEERCPECATTITASLAANRQKMRPAELSISAGAVCLLFAPTLLLPLVGLSIIISIGPMTVSDGQITSALALLFLWHTAWWLLASRSPLRPFGAAHRPRGSLVRIFTILGVAFVGALGVILDPLVSQKLRPMVGGPMFRSLMQLAGFTLLPLWAALQVWAGAPLLARLAAPLGLDPDHAPPSSGTRLSRLAAVAVFLLLIQIVMAIFPVHSPRMRSFVAAGLIGCGAVLLLSLIHLLLRALIGLGHERAIATRERCFSPRDDMRGAE